MWKAEQNKKNTRDTGGEPLMFSAVYQFLTTKKNTKWPNSCRPENSKTTTTRIITTTIITTSWIIIIINIHSHTHTQGQLSTKNCNKHQKWLQSRSSDDGRGYKTFIIQVSLTRVLILRCTKPFRSHVSCKHWPLTFLFFDLDMRVT